MRHEDPDTADPHAADATEAAPTADPYDTEGDEVDDGAAPVAEETVQPDAEALPPPDRDDIDADEPAGDADGSHPDDAADGSDYVPPTDDLAPAPGDTEQERPEWKVVADLSDEHLLAHGDRLRRQFGTHTKEAWLASLGIIVTVRAFKEHWGGDEFHTLCRKYCHVGQKAAKDIVRYGVAGPANLEKIKEKVEGDAHIAAIAEKHFDYPTLNKMIGWCKPPDEDDGKKKAVKGEDDEEEEGNRPVAEVRRENVVMSDQIAAMDREMAKLKQRMAEQQHDYERVWAQATDQMRQLELSREAAIKQHQTITEQKDLIGRQQQALAERDADITRLLAAQRPLEPEPEPEPPAPTPPPPEPQPDPPVPVRPEPDAPTPSPEPVPPPTEGASDRVNSVPMTIGQMSRTDIDTRWQVPQTLRGGARAGKARRDIALRNRTRCFALLDHEPDAAVAQDARNFFAEQTLKFYWQVSDEMNLRTTMALPVPK